MKSTSVVALIVILILGFAYFHSSRVQTSQTTSQQTTTIIPNGNFEGIFWPTVLLGVTFGNSSTDIPFLQMLQSAGVKTVVLETDPTFFQTYISRFSQVITEARGMGFKIHIINQLAYSGWYNLAELPLPFSSTPSLSQFTAFETQAMNAYASFHPDYLSVLAEPSLYHSKMGTSFTDAQIETLTSSLCSTVQSISPQTQTWIDLIPSNTQTSFISGLAAIGNLNAIGLDYYGDSSSYSLITALSNAITSSGKIGGFTETWAYGLYSAPQYDTSATVSAQAAWFSSAYSLASSLNMTGAFDPFFTEKFVSTSPLILPFTSQGMQTMFNQLYSGLLLNQRTSIFSAYQSVIQ